MALQADRQSLKTSWWDANMQRVANAASAAKVEAEERIKSMLFTCESVVAGLFNRFHGRCEKGDAKNGFNLAAFLNLNGTPTFTTAPAHHCC